MDIAKPTDGGFETINRVANFTKSLVPKRGPFEPTDKHVPVDVAELFDTSAIAHGVFHFRSYTSSYDNARRQTTAESFFNVYASE